MLNPYPVSPTIYTISVTENTYTCINAQIDVAIATILAYSLVKELQQETT